MGLEVTKLRVPPDAYYPGLFTDVFVTPLIRSFLTPETRAATEAVMAYLEGDEEPLRALVNEWLVEEWPAKGRDKRRRSNAFYTTGLKADYLVHGKQLPIPLVVGFLKAWEEVLEEHARARRNKDEAAWFLSNSYSFPKLSQALSEYKEPGEKEKEAVRAAFLAEKESPAGEPTTLGKIEWRIKRDNSPFSLKDQPDLDKLRKAVKAADEAHASTVPGTREHQQTKQALRDAEDRLEKAQAPVVFSHERSTLFEDASALAEFAAKHDKLLLDEMRRKAPLVLSKQQLEVFRLADAGLDNKEIAEELDRSADQIGVVKHQAFKTLRRAVGL